MGQLQEQDQCLSAPARAFTCRPDQTAYAVIIDGSALLLRTPDGIEQSRWRLDGESNQLELEWMESDSRTPQAVELLAAIEAAFAHYPDRSKLSLHAPCHHFDELLRAGVLIRGQGKHLTVTTELFWQNPRVWLVSSQPFAFPLSYVFSQGRRHPLRPPKPVGTVYQRYIPWLDATLSFRAVNLRHDLERFNRWMNDDVVAAAWREEGDLAKHDAYLRNVAADPHTVGLIASIDDEAFGYFEIYWAKEDRIAPFYNVEDFDRGWHVLIGEPRFRGKPFVTAWLPSISHYLFLDDCRTQRIVIEPRSDNYRMIRNLGMGGYLSLKEFDFPHKRAVLNMLLRERFFAERLWVPREVMATSPSSLS